MDQIKNFTIFLLFVLTIISCNQKHNLTAEIEGLGNDTLLVEYRPVSQLHLMIKPLKDTVVSSNNKFVYSSPSDDPIFAKIIPQKAGFKRLDGTTYFPRDQYLNILLKPDDKISIKGKLHEYYTEYEAVGSDFNNEFSQLRQAYIKETSEAAKIDLMLDTLISKKGDKEVIKQLYKKRDEINGIAEKKQFEYVENNWDKELSAFFLSQHRIDKLLKYYENLDASVRDGHFKDVLNFRLQKYYQFKKISETEQKIVAGKIAPDFTLKSISGKDLSLSSIDDKIIVLDFWGSWCTWCIKGFPKMKDYYNKYKSQMEIIGIACSDTEVKWKKAVEDNNLEWLNVISENDKEKDISILYGIRGYPTKIILDKDKTIIAKFVGESEEFYNKIDELMKNHSR